MRLLRLQCSRCDWRSKLMGLDEERELGVPWYCDRCGARVEKFVRGTAEEIKSVD